MERVLVRYGDLTLKGRNQHQFINSVKAELTAKLADLDVVFEWRHDRCYIVCNNASYEDVSNRLKRVAGLYSYSRVLKTDRTYDAIAEAAVALLEETTQAKPMTFKVETKRADKTFPSTSQEVTREISRRILPKLPHLIVDVKEPECTLDIELRDDGFAYLFVGQEYGMGGFPAGTAGKGLLLLSGGIDSPVAGYLAMKKGLSLDLMHFESTPLTSIEAAQKAVDLASILAKYAPKNQIKLHMVPFEPLHSALLAAIPESYSITIMRRMMYRIATRFIQANAIDLLVNGESLGQVASQTVESMKTISNVTDALILRPLVTYDKNDIIKLARELETFDISNRPFEDCCAIYVPKSPVIRPDAAFATLLEKRMDFERLVQAAVSEIKTLVVTAGRPIDLASKGLTVAQALS